MKFLPSIEFKPLFLPNDQKQLIDLLTQETWPYHVNSHISADMAFNMTETTFLGDNQETFWIIVDKKKIGIIQIRDLDDVDDGSPIFDLRISASHRGHGVGRTAVQWINQHLFTRFDQLERIVATTRADNNAMRAVLCHCNYVQEGYFRRSWPDQSGYKHDSVFYAVLRSDWQNGALTAIDWDDSF